MREPAFHPYGAEVLTVLDGVFMEGPHLGEAKLAMQGHRCVVGQDYARDGDVHWLISKVSEQRSVQVGAYALAAARDMERDADFDGLPEAFMLPIGAGWQRSRGLGSRAGQRGAGEGRSSRNDRTTPAARRH